MKIDVEEIIELDPDKWYAIRIPKGGNLDDTINALTILSKGANGKGGFLILPHGYEISDPPIHLINFAAKGEPECQ